MLAVRSIAAIAVMLVVCVDTVVGQDYPNRPVRVVTGAPGSGADFTARLIQGISPSLTQPVIVDNRGTGILAGDIAAKATPDGYTMLVIGGGLWIGPLLQSTPYDPVRDFLTVTLTSRDPAVLVVHPSVAAKSVKELLALAKAKPGELNYASSGTGSSGHLAGELFKSLGSVNIVRVPYKSTSFSMTALIAGEVQMQFGSPPSLMGQVKLGKLRALAVTTAEPSALAPGLPTIAASGVPGYEAVGLTGVFVPARTPVLAVNRLNQEIVRLFGTADIKEKVFSSGSEVVGNTPQEAAGMVKSDMARWGKVIKDAGIKAD